MKSFKFFLMSVAVVLFAAGACNKSDTEEETTTPEIEVDSTEVEVDALGGTVSIEYSVTDAVEGETLSVAVDTTWLSAVVGDDTIDITVEPNTTKEERSATVTLSYSGASNVSLTVTQVIPVIEVDSEISVPFTPGTTTVSFSMTNAVEGDEVTATIDNEVVTDAVVDQDNSTVTLTISGSTEQTSRSVTVTLSSTYAQDVAFSVIQERAPYPAEYDDFLGTWVVTDMYGLSATIEILENVEGESYTVKGWQFSDERLLSDMGVEGLEGITNSFSANYKAETKSLDVPVYNFGNGSVNGYGDGTMYLAGTIYFGGNDDYDEGKYTITPESTTYNIATVTLDDLSTGKLVGETVEVTKLGGSFDIIQMAYAFITTSNTVYSWNYDYDYGSYLPCTLTKVDTGTASTSSVKSSKKVVPVKSETKVVEL